MFKQTAKKGIEMKDIYSALIKAQAQFPTVEKNTVVKAGKFNFKFASYSAICEAIRKPLGDNNLAFIHCRTSGNDVNSDRLETVLIHESGESITTSQPVPIIPDAQQYGAWLTYMRRYQLSALLGLATDEDVEAPAISEIEVAPEWSVESISTIQDASNILERSVSDLLSEITNNKRAGLQITDVPLAWESHILKKLDEMIVESGLAAGDS
mgnify:CR=1 FL=1